MLIRAGGLPLRWLEELANVRPTTAEPESALAENLQSAFDAALQAVQPSPLRTAIYKARRDFFQKRKLPATGLQQQWHQHKAVPAIAVLLENLGHWEELQKTGAQAAREYAQALLANYRHIQQVARNESICRALLFASHDLLRRLPAFAAKPVEQFNKKDRQTALSLLQYLTRAAAKTSPLSRFTTVDLKRIGQEIEPEGDFLSSLKPQVTPNVALLPALYEVLLREPAVQNAFAVSLNPCIVIGAQGRTWLYFDGENESFQQSAANPVVEKIIGILLENRRNIDFAHLVALLENEVEADTETLRHLLLELIDLGLLEWVLPEKGMSPGWCGALYQFLGFLPEPPQVAVDAASLLQWLRTAARTLPFQPIEVALEIQQEAVRMVQRFFEKYEAEAPNIPAEQIFFEDVAEIVTSDVPESAIHQLAGDLAACWKQRNKTLLPALRSKLYAFARERIAPGQSVDFLTLSKAFLNPAAEMAPPANAQGNAKTSESKKIGALMQVFRDETGSYRAVVNGLFPGGGKLLARWLHLFAPEHTEQLKAWFSGGNNSLASFPWQGWSNANFQPAIAISNLLVPGGRTSGVKGSRQIFLGDLAIQSDISGFHLINRDTDDRVVLTDLGLEAPESRPPVMQLLWHLGVPYVSLEALLPPQTWIQGGAGWKYKTRVGIGALVLSRKTWQIESNASKKWLDEKEDAAVFRRISAELAAMEIPRRFFARIPDEKPRFFDAASPLSILLFTKLIQSGQSMYLTEMLPLPEQCVVNKDGLRAAEYVLEIEV